MKKKRLRSNIIYQKKENQITWNLLKKPLHMLISLNCSHLVLLQSTILLNTFHALNQDFTPLHLTQISLEKKSNLLLSSMIGLHQMTSIEEVFVQIILLKLKKVIKLLENYLLLQLFHLNQKYQFIWSL